MRTDNIEVLYQHTVSDQSTMKQAAEQQTAFACMDIKSIADEAVHNPALFVDCLELLEETSMHLIRALVNVRDTKDGKHN